MRQKDDSNISRIRAEIIRNAESAMQSKTNARQAAALELEDDGDEPPPRKRSEVRDDDGNIRVVIYIPRFLRNIILVSWLIWFGLFPAVAALVSDSPGHVVYAPVFLILSLFGLFVMVMVWYLFWWLVGLHLTCGALVLLAGLFAGAVEFSQLQELMDTFINRLR